MSSTSLSCSTAAFALGIALVGGVYMSVVYPELPPTKLKRGEAKLVVLSDVISSSERQKITQAFGDEFPSGKFLLGRHGTTHFHMHGTNLEKLIVLAHGLGTNSHIYDAMIAPLVDAGYAVLTYDYFGHGWSVAEDRFLTYDKQVVLDQLEDLLDHVLPGSETPVFGIVGHSTGGCVGILADHYLARSVDRLFFISPAFFADKPLIAQLADMVPSFVHGILRRNLLHNVISDAYLENGEVSWAKGMNGDYLFSSEREVSVEKNKKMFAHHPFIIGGIFGLNAYILRTDLLPFYRTLLSSTKARTMIAWGVLDVVVPYNEANVAAVSVNSKVTVLGMEGLGHESPMEDPQAVSKVMIDFFQSL